MKEERERQEVAHSDEEDQAEESTSMMPDAPRLDTLRETVEDTPIVQDTAAPRDQAEYNSRQEFVSLIIAETKRLQQIEYRPDAHAIKDAVSRPVPALHERICSGEERHR